MLRNVWLLAFIALIAGWASTAEAAPARAVGMAPAPVFHNTTALQQFRSERDHSLVLFTSVGWTWCDACATVRNVTETVRRHVAAQTKKRFPIPRTTADGTPLSKSELAATRRERDRRSVGFAVFDCSGVPANTPHHPCTTEAIHGFPSIALYTGDAALTATPKQTATADALLAFLAAHVADVTAMDRIAPTRGGVVTDITPVKSLIARVEAGELRTKGGRTLLLVLPQSCRQCAGHLVAAEAAARDWVKRAGSKDFVFARAVDESRVIDALGIRAAAPFFVFVPAVPTEPVIEYRGALEAEAIVQFAQYHLAATADGQVAHVIGTRPGAFANVFSAQPGDHGVRRVTDGRHTSLIFAPVVGQRLRVVLFVADWLVDASAAAFRVRAFFDAAFALKTVADVEFVAVDMTNAEVFRDLMQRKNFPRVAPPFAATCFGAACAAGVLTPLPFDLSTSNIIHFVKRTIIAAKVSDMSVTNAESVEDAAGVFVSHRLVDHWATTEPLAPSSEHDALKKAVLKQMNVSILVDEDAEEDGAEESLDFVLPSSAYEHDDGIVLLVTSGSGDNVARRRSARSLAIFEHAAATMAQHRAMKADPRRVNAAADFTAVGSAFAVIDGSRYRDLTRQWAPSDSPLPFIVAINKTADGSYDFKFWTFVTDTANDVSIANLIIEKVTRRPRFDADILRVTADQLDDLVLDPTVGVLLLVKGATCPHSANLYPTFVGANFAFRKDQHKVKFATIDVEALDAVTKSDMAINHVPQLRWFPKGQDKTIAGEVVDMTPFKESIIEFVSDEMGFAHMDLQQTIDEYPSMRVLVGRDVANVVAEDATPLVMFLYNARLTNADKFDLLTRVSGYYANATRKPDNTTAMPFLMRRVDGSRYRKALERAGLGRFAARTGLPRLVILPTGANRDLRAFDFATTGRRMTVISVARWITTSLAIDPSIEIGFDYTEAEIEAENDKSLLDVKDLDQSNFIDFVDSPGDVIVLYYATWCRYSQTFMEEYAKVAIHFASTDVRLGRVDVPGNVALGNHQGIQSFPTIIVYFDGAQGRRQGHGHVYSSNKTAADLIRFVESTRGSSKVQELEEERRQRISQLTTFDAASFTAAVNAARDFPVLVQFSTTWCGHCRHMDAVLVDILEGYLAANMTINVGKIDAETHAVIASRYNATTNFPVVLLFPASATGVPSNATAVRKSVQYTGDRFSNDLMKFVVKHDPRKPPTARPPPRKEEPKVTPRPKVKPAKEKSEEQTQQQRAFDKKSREARARAERSPDDLDWVEPDESPEAFKGFPTHVRKFNERTFREAISGTNIALVLHYATPGDEAVMQSYAVATNMLMPLDKKKVLTMGVVEAGSHAALTAVLGATPSITMYRGFAKPEIVKFVNNEMAQSGDGGNLKNVSHILDFVKKQLEGSKASSIELEPRRFAKARDNTSITFAVFFYAPYCQHCRKPAEAYDEVAQMHGHVPNIIFARVDISTHANEYIALGSKPLPAVFVYDAGRYPGSLPRHYATGDFSRPSFKTFISPDFDVNLQQQLKDIGKSSNGDDEDADDESEDTEEVPPERDVKQKNADLIAQAIGEREQRRKHAKGFQLKPFVPLMIPTETHLNTTLRDFPKGALVLLTAPWCAHCKGALTEYMPVVGALRDRVVVASFECETPAILKRFGVTSVPSIVFIDSVKGVTVMRSRKRSAEDVLQFAVPLLPAVPDTDLPFYTDPVDEQPTPQDAASDASTANKSVATATVMNTVADYLQALKTVSSTADGRGYATAVVLVVTTSACRGPTCDQVTSLADFLAETFTKIGAIVGRTESKEVARKAEVTSVPSIAVYCTGWSAVRSLGRLSQRGATRALHSLSDAEVVAFRVNELIDDHCAQPKSEEESRRGNLNEELDSAIRKDEMVTDLAGVWSAHRSDSVLVYVRPGDCTPARCKGLDAAWREIRELAADPDNGPAATTNYLLVDPQVEASRPLRKALFARQIRTPLIAFVAVNWDAKPNVKPYEQAIELTKSLVAFTPLNDDAPTGAELLEFLDRKHRGQV